MRLPRRFAPRNDYFIKAVTIVSVEDAEARRVVSEKLLICLRMGYIKNVIASAAKQSNESMNKQYFVYIMTNEHNSVLYTGITSDLNKRIWEHKEKLVDGFTKRYNIVKLVYYEIFQDPENAIRREKQIKGGLKTKKIDLINKANQEWRDLFAEI